VQHVGFVLICYGVADALGSLLCGFLVKIVGRVPIFLFAAATNVALIVTWLSWEPDPSQPVIFFVLAALWGLADAVWQTQINGEFYIKDNFIYL
jgi:predicted MFS family arabinose efflux permease